MILSLPDIRRQLAEGRLREAVGNATAYAESCDLAKAVNGLTELSAGMEETRQLWNTGQLDYDDYARSHARTTHSLLDWLDQLPATPTPTAARKMLREDLFKGRVLWMLVAGKLIVLGRFWYHWRTGGFNDEQGWAAIGILAPTLAAYLYVVLEGYLREHKEPPRLRYVSGPLVRLAYLIIPAYMLALLILVEKKAMSDINNAHMMAGFALVESVLGGYVGRVVSAFFGTAAPRSA